MKEMNDLNMILRALSWVPKVFDYFKQYRPETKSMTINYKNLDAEIELLLYIPDNIKRKIRKVEIPAYQNFVVSEMRDESFNKIGNLWTFEDGKWKLDPSKLPSSEKYLLTLKGKLPADALDKIVFVQPATNKDRTEEIERYWLASMIRNVEILERLWNALNIEDIAAGVRIGIERCISSAIPKDLERRIKTIQKWIRVGRERDRDELMRTWLEMRRMARSSSVSVDDIIDIIYKFTTSDFFSAFLSIDKPYIIGEIRREETFKGTFPEKMYVEACTNLTLKQPTAEGYLIFKKKEYTNALVEEFNTITG